MGEGGVTSAIGAFATRGSLTLAERTSHTIRQSSSDVPQPRKRMSRAVKHPLPTNALALEQLERRPGSRRRSTSSSRSRHLRRGVLPIRRSAGRCASRNAYNKHSVRDPG